MCETCIHPYSKFPNNASECFTCGDFTCEVCDEDDPDICYGCLEGLRLVNYTCQSCSANCLDCFVSNDMETCFQCEDGYVLF